MNGGTALSHCARCGMPPRYNRVTTDKMPSSRHTTLQPLAACRRHALCPLRAVGVGVLGISRRYAGDSVSWRKRDDETTRQALREEVKADSAW